MAEKTNVLNSITRDGEETLAYLNRKFDVTPVRTCNCIPVENKERVEALEELANLSQKLGLYE
jgi:hypothetical protein